VVLPDRNRKDMVDIPESVRKDMELVFVKRIQEALELTLESVQVVVAGPDSGPPEGTAARA
jgi:ATP-dependent Lon protease